MSVRTDVINLNINVNGNKALNELNDLRKKAADIKFEMQGLTKGTKEYIAKNNELKQVTASMNGLKKEIGLAALSQKELVKELGTLKALRGSVTPFSDEYKKLSASIKQVEDRLYNVKNGVQGFSSFMSKIKDEVKQFGVVAAGYLGFQFITSQFQNMISGLAKVSDQFADIRKVTGLSEESVKSLNKELSQIDTRTSTSNLREIAVAAGKLGKDSAEDIMAFVRSADQINVALGDDLTGSTEEIMKKLGKISQVFKTEEMYGTEQGLLKIGSAINELSAASNASADYMVEFGRRMAGVAPLAGISVEQILGLGATLDQLGQTSEVSSTALSKLFVNMAADSAKFAKYAGMQVDEFKALLEKDFMAALIRMLEGVKQNSNGINELAESLGDLGLDGGRVIGVLGSLANNTDTLRTQLDLANISFDEGISLTNEFAIKNTNLAATLDKIGKEFNKMMTSGMLHDMLTKAANATLKFITALKDLPALFERYKFTIIAVAVAVALLTKNILLNAAAWALEKAAMVADAVLAARKAAVLLLSAAYNVLTGNLTRASAAWSMFTKSLAGGGIGIAVAAIVAIGIAIDKLINKTSLLSQIQRDANKSTVETTSKIEILTKVAKDNTASIESRRKALKELIAISPEHLKNLDLDNILTEKGTNIIKAYISQLNEKAQAEARYNLMVEKMKEREDKRATIRSRLSGSGLDFSDQNIDAIAAGRRSFIPDVYSDLAKLNDEINSLQNSLVNAAKKTEAVFFQPEDTVINAAAKAMKATVGARKKWLDDEIKRLDTDYDKLGLEEVAALKRNRRLKEKYQEELNNLDGKKTSSAKSFNTDYTRLKAEADKFFKDLQRLKEQAQIKGQEPEEREIAAVEAKYRELTEKAKNLYLDQLKDKKRYSDAELLIEEAKQQDLNEILKKYLKQRADAAAAGEYDAAIEAWREYIGDKKQATAKDYADGKIGQAEYSAEIEALNRQEKDNLVLIAEDYSDTVKRAANDRRKFVKDAEKQTTDDAIKEMERRKEYADREKLAGAQGAVYRARPGSDARLQAQKNFLQVQFDLETQFLEKRSEQYKTAEAKLIEDIKELQQQANRERIDNIMQFVGFFQDALGSLETFQRNQEAKLLNDEKKKNDEKKNSYKKQLDSKLISRAQYDRKVEQADADLDKKAKEIQREQAKREKALKLFNAVINVAAGIAASLAYGGPLGIALAIATGIAGALQVAAIANEPLPELGTGYWLKTGPKHREAGKGTTVRIERDEAVVSARAMTDNKVYSVTGTTAQITSALNSRNGGASWATGASVGINPAMPGIMQQGGTGRGMFADGGAIAGADSAEVLNELRGMRVELQQSRADMANWNKNLKASVSIKEYREKEALYDNAKKSSAP